MHIHTIYNLKWIYNNMEYQAIVLAAGKASRSKLSYNKVFYKIDDKPIVFLSALNFIEDKDCHKIFVVCQNKEEETFKLIFKNIEKISFVSGGETRQESVYNALKLVDSDYVIIHDAARPFYSKKLLTNLKNKLVNYDCVIPVIDSIDTLKIVRNNKVIKTINREEVKRVQTPQGFKTSNILLAHKKADNNLYSDDSSMIEDILNEEVFVIDGEKENIKFTNQDDFIGDL